MASLASPPARGPAAGPPSPRSRAESLAWSDGSASDSESPSTPSTDAPVGRRASTHLISQAGEDMRRLLGGGTTGTQLIEKYCCGGGCCRVDAPPVAAPAGFVPVALPDTEAFRRLELKLGPLGLGTPLTGVVPLPPCAVALGPVPGTAVPAAPARPAPPSFVQPHPPYSVFPAPVYHVRELTKAGAEKRTFHFDLDVTDYPDEGGIDFKVGGAIGICPPNAPDIVDEVFDALCVPRAVRDRPVLLSTRDGRWPTIWGDHRPRELVTTRREVLTWCSDLQSSPPTKPLFRLLAEYADAPNESKILLYLASAQGQAAFCDVRTGPHVTLGQLLNAFPSSRPPLGHLLSVLGQLMPRFYSLSNDPHISSARPGLPGNRRLIEIAVTVHETPDWHSPAAVRSGVGSGFMERLARRFIEAERAGLQPPPLDLVVPMFRGLMANPLSQRFGGDGPMILIGAGVGMAPFRGFILNRLKKANCANKIWLIQGVRDSLLDEIYSGELGDHEREIKKVVQSRRCRADLGEARYVQDEVRHQADIVWFVINALDGRIFVCGSSKGMGEGVESALVGVAMDKAGLNEAEAKEFWEKKKAEGQYIPETW